MHVSLDSALGRQRRLNSVGESVLQIAPNASAAYSLRSLTGGDPKVVRVRRASDNGERDFTSSDVTSGEMLRWVNAQAIKPLDIQALQPDGRTGDFLIAKAAYSLRSLGTRQATLAATGDTVARADDKFVAQVRRNVNGDLKSFTATEVTDGTLTSFVNESFTSSLPLDVSGSASAAYGLRNLSSSYSGNVVEVRRSSDDTTQNFKAAEITDGTLVNFVNEDVNKLDLQAATGGLVGNVTNKTETGFDLSVNNEGSVGQQRIFSPSNATAGIYNVTFDVSVTSGSLSGITATVISDNREIVVGSNSQNFTLTSANNGGAIYFRTAADAVADVSITNITLTQTSSDGHVSKWYDQSGNSNDAVQATPASQPKIVDAGSLVTDRDGKLALNGKGAKLDLPDDVPMLSTDGTYSLFAVVDFDDQRNGNDNFNNILRFDSNTAGGAASARKPLVYLDQTTGSLIATGPTWSSNPSGSVDYTLAETLSVQLFTNIANPALSTGNNTLYADGALVGSTNNATSVNTNNLLSSSSQIFDNHETTVTHFLSEVIYYPSDQSDKRRAIEESISGHYGITLPSFNRDGFVKTWYDQSVTNQAGDTATGNHAVQATAAEQPLIVSAGSLVPDNGIDFDGTNNNRFLVAPSVSGLVGSLSMFCVSVRDNAGTPMALSNSLSAGRYFLIQENDSTSAVSPRNPLTGAAASASVSGDERLTFALTTGATFTAGGANGGAVVTSTADYGDDFSGSNLDQITIGIYRTVSPAGYFNGRIREILVYDSDQTDNRTAIEANIGEAYSITGIPAYDDEVDGFVETWYDQSGNSNDAVQATAGSQPKIVNAGALVADNGIDLDGSQFLQANSFSGMGATVSMITASVHDSGGGGCVSLASSASGVTNFGIIEGNSVTNVNSRNTTSITASASVSGVTRLSFSLTTGQTSTKSGALGGTLVENTSDYGDDFTSGELDILLIGKLRVSSGTLFNGRIREALIYNTDESDNRTAIEANIANHYNITLV